MKTSIAKNLLVAFITLAVSALFLVLIGFLLKVIFDKLEQPTKNLAEKLDEKFKCKHKIIIVEVFYILFFITFFLLVLLSTGYIKSLIIIIYLFLVFFSSMILGVIEHNNQNDFSLLYILIKGTKKENFLLNQVKQLFYTIIDSTTIIIFPLLGFIYSIFLALNWPVEAYFFLLIILPVSINIWIYFSVNKKQDGRLQILNETLDINFRRVLSYIFLLIITFKCSYNSYLINLELISGSETKITILFLNIYSTIFIAGERVLKAWSDIYLAYRKEKEEKSHLLAKC